MTREEEERIIARVLAGDSNAFESLVLSNQRKVYNLCLKMTGNPSDAEDLAQDAFIRAYHNLGSFKGESSFSKWLYRLTSNICIDHLRREKRREAGSLTYQDETGTVHELELPDTRFAPEGALERREIEVSIQSGLNALTVEHREILIMREMEGRTYDEIGALLGLTNGTVKSRISRARMNLSKFLMEAGNIPQGKSSRKRSIERRAVSDETL